MNRLLVALALTAVAAPALAAAGRGSCEWRAPAHDPFVGDVPGAVDRYTDIPAPTRARLKARMKQFAYDDIVAIGRDAIEGNFRYEPALLDMHFGQGRLCGQVTRHSWKPGHEERGLAYCESGHCVVVPLVCRNVSRIVRKPAVAAMGAPGGAGQAPLAFDPPAAGVPQDADTPAGAEPTARPLQAPAPALGRATPATDAPLAATPLPPLLQLPPAGDVPVADTPFLPAAPDLPAVAPPVGGTLPDVPALVPQPGPGPTLPMPGLPSLPSLPPAPPVPEPSAALLWAAGLAALAWGRRRRHARLSA